MDSLIDRLKKNDPQAISEVYDKYAPAINGIILGIVESPSRAEEVLELTFLRILKEIHGYNGHLSVFSWMMTIARKTAQESITQNTGSRHTKELKSGIDQNVLDRMEPECREVIICLCLRGYSLTQTADALNISPEEVKKHLRNGLTKINTHFKGEAKV